MKFVVVSGDLDIDLKKHEGTVPLNVMDIGAQATHTLSEMKVLDIK
jgi:hypothetical protein